MNEKLKRLKEIMLIVKKYRHALGLLNFDFETIAPVKSQDEEADVINFFANELFKITNGDEMKSLIEDLYREKDEMIDLRDRSLIEKLHENLEKTKKFTPEFDFKLNQAYSDAYSSWLKAKGKADYSLFKGDFEKLLNLQEQAIALRENKFESLYDNYLNDCEKGVLQADLDRFFDELKQGLIALIGKINASDHKIRTDFLTRFVPVYKQEEFSKYLLTLNGYDFSKGALATTEHPFTSDIAENDARVTTHYYENSFVSNLFTIIHEGGHAIFMQNEPKEDHEHFINDYVTNGMHESVSRFYENVIGRSQAYIHLIYPKFIENFPEFADVSEREFYEGVNVVKPSLIRTEADEVTYGLHVVIRYEMEKAICNKQITLDEVPQKWNELYKKYLGVSVPDDAKGVLQDVHWSGGFGYFPSYALGNCYNAIYYKKMQKEIPVDELVRKGDLESIKEWLKQNVFAKANLLTPKEWLFDICGEDLSPKPFLDYLNAKYADIYKF